VDGGGNDLAFVHTLIQQLFCATVSRRNRGPLAANDDHDDRLVPHEEGPKSLLWPDFEGVLSLSLTLAAAKGDNLWEALLCCGLDPTQRREQSGEWRAD